MGVFSPCSFFWNKGIIGSFGWPYSIRFWRLNVVFTDSDKGKSMGCLAFPLAGWQNPFINGDVNPWPRSIWIRRTGRNYLPVKLMTTLFVAWDPRLGRHGGGGGWGGHGKRAIFFREWNNILFFLDLSFRSWSYPDLLLNWDPIPSH